MHLKLIKYLFFVLFLFNSSLSLAIEKFLYIDVDFIMNNSLAGKSILKQLENQKNKDFEEFKKITNQLKDKEKKIVNQKNLLNEEEFKKKITLFRSEVSAYELKKANKVKNINKKKAEGQKSLFDSLNLILKEYSKKNSVDYIINRQNIVIGKSEYDITKVILQSLNSKVKNIKLK